MRSNGTSQAEDDNKLVDGLPEKNGSNGQPVPTDAPAAFPDPSWGVAKLLEYGAAKWRDGFAKLKASVLDQWDDGNAVKFSQQTLPARYHFQSTARPNLLQVVPIYCTS
jgi:hypothetical protein